jgi:hypothetical protein
MADWKGKSQDYGKVDFDFVLMTHIQDTNKQLARLPHESIIPNGNEPIGTKYSDIEKSYCDMVQQFSQLLKPYWDDIYREIKIEQNERTFNGSNLRFGFLMELCGRKSFLFTRIKTKVSGEDGS